jgi:hypothetical protein
MPKLLLNKSRDPFNINILYLWIELVMKYRQLNSKTFCIDGHSRRVSILNVLSFIGEIPQEIPKPFLIDSK